MTIEVPGSKTLNLKHLVMDFNGTLACDGKLMGGVAPLLKRLAGELDLHVVTADTNGTARTEFAELPVKLHIVQNGTQKLELLEKLGTVNVVAMGNGRNDSGMLKAAALGIAILGPEGFWPRNLEAADLAIADIRDALTLLLRPERLIATLRD